MSSKRGVFVSFLLLPWLTEIPELNANSEDPDQSPRSVLIWVYAICQCHFYAKAGINGLIRTIVV